MGMEITQVVQSIDNAQPLIAGKPTIVRVYLNIEGPPSLADVSGILSAYRPSPLTVNQPQNVQIFNNIVQTVFPATTLSQLNNLRLDLGQRLSPDTLLSLNTIKIDSNPDIAEKRRDINRSINFQLPPNWINSGYIHFTFTPLVNGLVSTLPCDHVTDAAFRGRGCENLIVTGSGRGFPAFNFFRIGPPFKINLLSVPYTIPATPTTPAQTVYPSQTDLDLLTSWVKRTFPSANVRFLRSTWQGTTFVNTPTCAQVNAQLFVTYVLRHLPPILGGGGIVDSDERLYGMYTDRGGWQGGCSPATPSPVGSGPAGNGAVRFGGWDLDGSYGDWYGAHELGHGFGRKHVSHTSDACDGTPGGPFDSYPFPNGLLSGSPLSKGYFGFDTGDGSLRTPTLTGIPIQVYPGDIWTDVMTYRCNQWMSSNTHNSLYTSRLLEEIQGAIRSLFGGRGTTSSAYTSTGAASDTLLVTGNIDLDKRNVTMLPFMTLKDSKITTTPASNLTNSSFSINLVNSTGNTIAQFPFQPLEYTDTPENESRIAMIGEVVPFLPDTRRIVIVEGNRTLFERDVSANAPLVEILPENIEGLLQGNFTLQWRGTDVDGDELSYSVLYSPDNGKTWDPIAVNIKDEHILLNTDDLPASERGLFRVVATDGVNTGVDDSDNTFRISSKPPVVGIVSPLNESNFTSAHTIVLDGYVNDIDGVDLNNTKSFVWTSDIQGILGYGSFISVTNLEPGNHTITFTAQDESGQKDDASIKLNITPFKLVDNVQSSLD
jgi:hypothetical protein